MKKLALLSVLIVCAFTFPALAQDTVAYYGYETGTSIGDFTDGISIWNSTAALEEVSDDASGAHTGDGYLHVTIAEAPANPWDNQSVIQGVPVEEGTSYRIGMWIKGTTGDLPAVNITVGNNDYGQIADNSGIVIGEDYHYYNCMVYITSSTDLGTGDPTTFRYPIHFFEVGEYFVDDVIVEKSTIGGITYNNKVMAVNFGYPLDYASVVSPGAFTITVDGASVTATSAKMVKDGDNVDPIVYLVLDSFIDEGSDVKVDYDGSQSLYYTDAAPTDETGATALDFTGEGATYDEWLEIPVGIFSEKTNKLTCKISPNPVINQLTIQSADAIQSYEIFDLSGKRIMEAKNQLKSNISVDVSGLQTGVYMLQVKDSKGNISSAKFIK